MKQSLIAAAGVVKQFTKDHIYIQIANLFFIATGLIIHLYLSSGAMPLAEYAGFKLIISIVGTLSIIFTAGFPAFAVQKLSRKEYSGIQVWAVGFIDLVVCFALMTVLILWPQQIGSLIFNNGDLNQYLVFVALILPAYLANSFITGYYNGLERYRTQAIITSVANIIKLVALLWMATNWGIAGATLAYGISGFILTIGVLIYYIPHGNWSLALLINSIVQISTSKQMWFFVIPINIYSFLNGAILTLDLIQVENVMTEYQFGVYSVLTVLSGVGLSLFAALGSVFFPAYSKLSTKSELRRELTKDISIEIVIAVFGFIAYLVLGGFLLKLLYGQGFVQYQLELTVSALAFIIYAIHGLLCVKLQSINMQFESVIAIITSILIMYFTGNQLIINFGLMGAAMKLIVATLPVLIAIIFYLYWYLRRGSDKLR